jgi:hypothetical protein
VGNEILDLLHVKVHALRMTANYKPSIFEQEINKIIAEEYQFSCKECKETAERLKYQPITRKKSFLGGLFK